MYFDLDNLGKIKELDWMWGFGLRPVECSARNSKEHLNSQVSGKVYKGFIYLFELCFPGEQMLIVNCILVHWDASESLLLMCNGKV